MKYDSVGDETSVWHADGVIGEPVFIPRLGYGSVAHGLEDDGWVITQLYHPKVHKTEYVILDAQNISQGPICRIQLDFHIPYSFHGTFCPYTFRYPLPSI